MVTTRTTSFRSSKVDSGSVSVNASASASGMPIKSERKIREYAPCGPTFVAGAGQLLAPTAERGCRKWLFLGFQLPNFFAKEVDVRQITHGKHSMDCRYHDRRRKFRLP